VHYWFGRTPPSGCYDNFGFDLIPLKRLRELESKLPPDEWNNLWMQYLSIDDGDDEAMGAFSLRLNKIYETIR
jgi:hypothetical protein